MYIPPHFQLEDRQQIFEIIRQNSFALLISNGQTYPQATHLPFLIEGQKLEEMQIWGHFAKANRHALSEEGKIIFSGPHAYISPIWYEKAENVPTWNYLAVHLSGRIRPLAPGESQAMMEKMIAALDPEYHRRWPDLSPTYKERLFRGISPFEFQVEAVEAKAKASQNKSHADQKSVIAHLKNQSGTAAEMGDFMAQHLFPED